jgi:hypothetical protein
MRRTKPSVMMLMAPMAAILLMGLAGCVAGYVDAGPEWDGTVFVGGGYARGYDRGRRKCQRKGVDGSAGRRTRAFGRRS